MRLDESVAQRLCSDEYDRWMRNVAATGYCHNPVRLVGSSTTLHYASGEVLSEHSSASEPDGVTFTRCGNRRATRCESCSHEYKGDTWHMIMAGAEGGMKEVPAEVAEHPMVFLTLTAPSFGAVHTTALDRRTGVCEHGNPPQDAAANTMRTIRIAVTLSAPSAMTTSGMSCGSITRPSCGDGSRSGYVVSWLDRWG